MFTCTYIHAEAHRSITLVTQMNIITISNDSQNDGTKFPRWWMLVMFITKTRNKIPWFDAAVVFLDYSVQIKSSVKKYSWTRFRYMWTSLAPSGMSSWSLKSNRTRDSCWEHYRTTRHLLHLLSNQNCTLEFDVSPGDWYCWLRTIRLGAITTGLRTRNALYGEAPGALSEAKQHPGGPLVRFWREKEENRKGAQDEVIKAGTASSISWCKCLWVFCPLQNHGCSLFGGRQLSPYTHVACSLLPESWKVMGQQLIAQIQHLELTLQNLLLLDSKGEYIWCLRGEGLQEGIVQNFMFKAGAPCCQRFSWGTRKDHSLIWLQWVTCLGPQRWGSQPRASMCLHIAHALRVWSMGYGVISVN